MTSSTERARAPVKLPLPKEGGGVVEPHVAVDPADPRRAAAVATYPSDQNPRGIGRSVLCWRTSNAGRTWEAGRVTQAEHDGEGVADPLIGYGPDGALIAVAMTMPASYVDARRADAAAFTRLTSPTIEDVKRRQQDAKRPELAVLHNINVSRSSDHGRSWSGAVVPGSAPSDKPALAIDVRPDSPHRGNVYVTWQDYRKGQLAFSRSVDGGRTFLPAIRIGGCNGITMSQVAVGRAGSVHLLWHLSFWGRPDHEDPGAKTGIFYARSDDGGATFNEPVVIAEHSAVEGMGVCSLAASPSGALLTAWSEADDPAAGPGEQVRNTIRWIRSEDGSRWSDPVALSPVPANVSQGLPTVASTDHAWHVLAYEASPSRTAVRIYTAPHDRTSFRAGLDLASRGVGADDLYMHGNYQLRSAGDIAIVGDYVGLAGAGRVLAAAIALPETDDWRSTTAAYAAVFNADE